MKTIHVVENSLALAWEAAVIKCWQEGDFIPTEYDKNGDPNSRDVCAMIHVKSPMIDPRIHRCFPGGLNDLEKYRAEMLYGVHDHWYTRRKSREWEYTYHERLREYEVGGQKIDQIKNAIEQLKECGYTRRAQAVTWQAWKDQNCGDPTCLQRLWFRVQNYQSGRAVVPKLNMVASMRSNDAFKAAFMNMYAFTELQKEMADELGVEVGEYVHIADSFHIYGSYFDSFKGFLKNCQEKKVEDRVYNAIDMISMFIEGCDELLNEDMPEEKKELVRNRRAYLVDLEQRNN